MSAAAVLLQFLFALLGFLTSLPGIFSLLVGLVLFLGMSVIPRVTGQFRAFAHFHLWLAMWSIKRAAIVVTDHDEILFKSMEFDDLGVEKISFADDTKEFEDPAVALHYFKGIPFALADEVHGLLFDPRHAAVGTRKHDHEENGEMVFQATASERSMYEVFGWIRGVFEFPDDQHELVNLSHIRQLATGTERAEHSERVEEFYEKSRDPYQSVPSVSRLAMIILAICGPFAVLWFMASQGGGGGGGSTVGYGALLWFAGLRSVLRTRLDGAISRVKGFGGWIVGGAGSAGGAAGNIDWRRIAVVLAVVLPLPAIFLVLFVFVNPLVAILAYVAMGMGFWALPFLTLFARELGPFGGALSRYLYLTLGLAGWDRPVFEWTPAKYVIREADELGDLERVHWYGLANSLVGFTFQPGSESWENGTLEKQDIENRLEYNMDATGALIQSDGGTKTDLPVEYERFPEQQRAVYGGFVPASRYLRADAYYLDTGIWFQRFTNAAVGERALRKLLQAKEKYGGDQSMDDSTLMKLVVGCGAGSFIAGLVVFFL